MTLSQDKAPTVLVVDDEASAVSFISKLLSSAGYEVVGSDSGYNAFNLLQRRLANTGTPSISLILCDWKMEGWDGIRLLNEVRAAPFGQIPFVLMSGKVTREELKDAAKQRADAILLKPVKKDALIEKVNALIDHPSQE